MRNSFKILAGVLAGALLALAVGAGAANLSYFGWNPSTGLEGLHGFLAAGGTSPTVTGTAGCGTIVAPVGGSTAGSFQIGTFSVSCAITLTAPAGTVAPNGWLCRFNDLTTPADLIVEASTTTSTCVSNAATLVTGDTVQFAMIAY